MKNSPNPSNYSILMLILGLVLTSTQLLSADYSVTYGSNTNYSDYVSPDNSYTFQVNNVPTSYSIRWYVNGYWVETDNSAFLDRDLKRIQYFAECDDEVTVRAYVYDGDDGYGTLQETNFWTLYVKEPDLRVESSSYLSKTSVNAGGSLTAYTTVKNHGNYVADFPVSQLQGLGFYLSDNTSLNTSYDERLGTVNINDFSAGESRYLGSKTLTIPSDTPCGEYYLFWYVDRGDNIEECYNEGNNTYYQKISVGFVPGTTYAYGAGTYCGSKTITASGGSGGTIFYQGTTSNGINSGDATTSKTVYRSGTYYFRARSSSGCWGPQGSVTVTINSVPGDVYATGGGSGCGEKTISASGGSGGTIYYQGTNSSGTSTSYPGNSRTVTTSGTHYFRARNSSGCWGSSDGVSVTINPVPGNVNVSGGGSSCGSITLNASGGTGGTIYYQGTNSNGTNTSYPGNSRTITSSGTHYFRARSSAGCWGNSGGGSVTIYPEPGSVSVSGAGTYCGSKTITASGGSGGTIYYQGTNSNGTSTSSAITSKTITTSGTYYFRARTSNGCWGTPGSANVTINSVPGSVSVSGGGSSCGSKIITASGGSGGTIYYQGTNSNGTSTSNSSKTITITSSGTYYFRARNSSGCWGTAGSATVTINPEPGTVYVSGGGSGCGTKTISASGGSGGTIYYQGTTSNGTSTSNSSKSITVTSSGTYYFRARSSSGCWGPQGSAIVTINPLPGSVSVSGGGSSCGSKIITASGGSGGTIYYQGTNSSGTSTSTTSKSITVTSSGTYYFRARSSAGCWGTPGSATVTINPEPGSVSVSGGGTSCGSTTLNASGGSGGTIYYQGTNSNGTSTSSAVTSKTIISSGTYYFRARSSSGCWGPQGSATVTINPLPGSVSVSGGGSSCGSKIITASGGTGGTIYYQGTNSSGTSTSTTSKSITVTSSGTYYFRARSSAGCWGTPGSATVTINPEPGSISVSGGGTSCGITTLNASGGSGGTIYYQGTTSNGTSTSNSSKSITVSSSGTYYFRARSSSGCWGPQGSATVTINPLPGSVSVSGGGSSCGSKIITASGGSGGIIYYQGTNSSGTSTSTTSKSITVTSSGTYYFRARSSAGCWGTPGSATVTINPEPGSVSVSGEGTSCGSTTLNASGGSGGTIYYQGTNSNGTSTSSAVTSKTITTSGTYYFRARSSSGCWGPAGSATVTINAIPGSVSVSGGGSGCGSKTITASGGSGGTIYYQGTTNNGTSTANASSSISVTSSGTYYFRARNSSGCWGTQGSVTVTINPMPVTPSGVSASKTTICEGNSTTLSYSGGSGTSFRWYKGSCGGTSVGSGNNLSVSPTSTTTYYGRWENNCGNSTCKSVTITVNPLPASPSALSATKTTICEGSSASLSYSGGSGTTFHWYSGSCGGTSVGTGNNLSVSPTSTTKYYGRWENNCENSPCKTIIINVNPLPDSPSNVSASETTICEGKSTTISYGGGSGTTFHWYSGSCGGTSVGTGNNLSVSPTSTTTYYGLWENNCGISDCKSVTITVNPLPVSAISVSASQKDICIGNSTTLSHSGGSGTTFHWYTGSCGGTSAGTGNNLSVTPSSTTTYYGRWENDCGYSTCKSVTISLHEDPVIDLGEDISSCIGESETLDAGSGFSVYEWNTGASSPTIDVTQAGTYSVTVTDNYGCSASDDMAVTFNDLPNMDIGGPYSACQGESVNLDAGDGFASYLWSTSETTQSISVSQSGNFDVVVTDQNGCSNSDYTAVTINDLPAVDLGGPYQSCIGEVFEIDAGDGFQTYTWSTGETSQTISVTESGTYSVNVTDANGCENTSVAQVTFVTVPSVDLAGPYSACEGDFVLLDAGDGFDTYLWSTGETTQTISVSETGNYSVTVGLCNSSVSDQTEVEIHELPVVNLGNDTAIFENEAIILNAGGGLASYFWSNGATDQEISVSDLAVGDHEFTVEVIDVNGCTASDFINITIIALPNSAIEDITNVNFIIYPNPASKSVFIKPSMDIKSEVMLSIFEDTGKQLYVNTIPEFLSQDPMRVDISGYLPGVYLLQLNYAGSIRVEKIMKLKK